MQLKKPTNRGAPLRSRLALAAAPITMFVFGSIACGSRTALRSEPRAADAGAACTVDDDCPGKDNKCTPVHCDVAHAACVFDTPIVCNDGDACTDDVCDPGTAACSFPPKTLDLDGDGHRGALPGHVPGDPGSCGDDCDDKSANAYPGGKEVCDGVDNDCNGVVDDGAEYVPRVGTAPVRVSTSAVDYAQSGSLAFQLNGFFATWNGDVQGKSRLFRSLLDADGKGTAPAVQLTQVEADNSGGMVAWTGDRYGVVWDDRRFDNYDLFFALYDKSGQKMAPGDVRLTDSLGFSINETIAWTGSEFAVAWQDGAGDNGSFNIRGQRVSLDGAPVGDAVDLSTPGAESPAVASGGTGLGFVWLRGNGTVHRVYFLPTDTTLAKTADPVLLTQSGHDDAIYPSIIWNNDVFVVSWYERTTSGSSIWATTVNSAGAIVTPTTEVAASPRFARDPALLPLGDRLLMVYADSRDENQGFEIYTRALSHDLLPVGQPARITNSPGDSVEPSIAFGPEGNVGVLYRDDMTGTPQAYFTHLVCQAR